MNELKVANVRKCLEILKQFYYDQSGDEELKKRAGKALDLLDNLFAKDPGEFEYCPVMQA